MLLCTEVVSASCRITPVPLRASVVIVVMHLYTAVHGTSEMLVALKQQLHKERVAAEQEFNRLEQAQEKEKVREQANCHAQ